MSSPKEPKLTGLRTIHELELQVPANCLGLNVGNQGWRLQITVTEHETKTKVSFFQGMKTCVVRGKKPHNVVSAKAQMIAFLEQYASNAAVDMEEAPAIYEAELQIPLHFVGQVIGKQGWKIEEFRCESGTEIYITEGNDKMKICKIRGGKQENVESAKAKINSFLEHCANGSGHHKRDDDGRVKIKVIWLNGAATCSYCRRATFQKHELKTKFKRHVLVCNGPRQKEGFKA